MDIITQMKKSKSAVEGDILPLVMNAVANFLAIPATRIINYAIGTKMWPTP